MIQIDFVAILAAVQWRHLWLVLAASLIWSTTAAFVTVAVRHLVGLNI